MWIDRILELEPGRRISTIKLVSLAEEHLHDHFAPLAAAPGQPPRPGIPIMPSSLIIEGVAQSGGILVGQTTGFRENIVLAKIARVEISREAIPGDTLRYDVAVERSDPQGVSTTCSVGLSRPGSATAVIGRIDLIFSVLDNSMALAGEPEAPARRFVFGEQFSTLLRLSGFDAGSALTSR